MNHWPILQGLVLVLVANGTPVLATRLLGQKLSWPLDCGLRLPDGRPLLGRSKTIRGVLLSILVTAAVAPLLGLPWWAGALAGSLAMVGDLLSSLLKRRLGLPSSSRALGLDQVPEALLPLLALQATMGLAAIDVLMATLLFWVGGLLLSRLLFALGIRDRPY